MQQNELECFQKPSQHNAASTIAAIKVSERSTPEAFELVTLTYYVSESLFTASNIIDSRVLSMKDAIVVS